MALPARTHHKNCPCPLRTGPRILLLGQVELRRHSPLSPFESKIVRIRHFQLAFSPLPVMMAAFRASLETSHCLNHRKPLPPLALRPRPAVAACSRCSECGLAWPQPSATPSPPASFERPAMSPSCSPMCGCFSEFGSLAGSMHFPAPLPWPSLAPPFPAAAASTIFRAALSAITPDSSSAGATGSLLAAPPPPSLSSSPNTAAIFSPFSLAPQKPKSFPSPSSADLESCNGAEFAGAAARNFPPPL